VHEVKRAPVG